MGAGLRHAEASANPVFTAYQFDQLKKTVVILYDLDSKLARATKQGADTYCAASTAIAELLGLGVDAMKAQEQSQGSKPMVCGVGISILDRHYF